MTVYSTNNRYITKAKKVVYTDTEKQYPPFDEHVQSLDMITGDVAHMGRNIGTNLLEAGNASVLAIKRAGR